jgi:hypothetical protein
MHAGFHFKILPRCATLQGVCGKIIGCMNTNINENLQKPKVFKALISGFDTTTNHMYLILFPVILDLFLWFGPQLKLKNLLTPSIQALSKLPGFDAPELLQFVDSYIRLLLEFFERFNLFSLLRTLPVGIPSLIFDIAPLSNPIGNPYQHQLSSLLFVVGISIIVLVIGLLLGSIYFKKIAAAVIKPLNKKDFKIFLKATLNVMLIPLLLITLLLFVSIPIFLLTSFLSMINPLIGQFFLIISIIFVFWSIIPMYFAPHSIYLFDQNLLQSLLSSISIIRFSLPRSALFLLSALLLMSGMNMLWSIPPENSWMLLVGIIGHAFISTAILASSFHFYLDAAQFTQAFLIRQKGFQQSLENINNKQVEKQN